jgi:hypothetical protein
MEDSVIVDTIPPPVCPEADNADHVPTPLCPGAPKPEVPTVPTVPKLVFIVPYRDRKQQQHFFANHMKSVLEDIPRSDYKIYYVEQGDTRGFNRGAMKNIGFLIIRKKYPNDYQNITLVFNDVDTMPYTKNFLNYETTQNNVKHFYGFTFTLGGIVSIKAGDFEKVGGFPNFWAWGFEDNQLQKRVLAKNMTIDRSQYYPAMDQNIMQMKDGISRIVNRTEFDRYVADTNEGFSNITDLSCEVNEETGFIYVNQFNTGTPDKPETNIVHDLRNGSQPFKPEFMQKTARRRGGSMKMVM